MDIITLYNARVYTLNPAQSTASALALYRTSSGSDGRILAVGEEDSILAEFGHRSQTWDLAGRTVIPGLTDAHIHLKQYALSLQKVDCETATRAECLQRVAARSANTPPGEWILGHGWTQHEWPEGFGTAADLDAVAPRNPVYLTAKSLHAGWANRIALEKAGLSANSSDPHGGQLQRASNGQLTGILFESAMEMVSGVVPDPTEAEIAEAIRQALPLLWKAGLTGAHDFDRQRCFRALQKLRDEGALTFRVLKSIPVEALDHALDLGLQTGFGDQVLRIGMVKAFADGALGPHTAAMLQPYDGEPENTGILLMDREELFEYGRKASEGGLSLAVHAIGDLANHEVLAALNQLREYTRGQGWPPARHRVEHVQLLHPDDLPLLVRSGAAASMQPIHAPSDMVAADRSWGSRSKFAYAWRTILDHRVPLAFGSDAPVESPNPFWGLHAAVTRRRPDGSPGTEGWYPKQRLNLTEALEAYTTGPAYLARQEHELGRLMSGYLADLLVLDTDPFQCPPDELRDIRPLATMVGGDWVISDLPAEP